jgi:spermidine synthase
MNALLAKCPPVTLSEQDGVRYLHLGSIWVQGAMRIRDPQRIVLEYIQRMLAALMWVDPADWGRGQAVHLGLGAGALVRFTLQQLRMPTTVVELNPSVIETNQRWFHLQRHDQLRVWCGEAGAWLRGQCPAQSVKLLFVDVYDEEAAAPVLDDQAFYADCHRVLEVGGVLSVNVFGQQSSLSRTVSHVAASFGAQQLWTLAPTAEGNVALIAARGVALPANEILAARAAEIEKRFGKLGLRTQKWPHWVHSHEGAG